MFDERNVNAQCRHCNRFLDGNIHEYYPRLVKRYGTATVQALIDQRWKIARLRVSDFQAIKEEYTRKLKELTNEQGN